MDQDTGAAIFSASRPDQQGRSDDAVAAWATRLTSPVPESARSRRMAHLGGIAATLGLVAYLAWRVFFTLPSGDDRTIALFLVSFEALPLTGLVLKLLTLWSIDAPAPRPITELPAGIRVAVLIPTYDEPAEVIAPTIAGACALEPFHETWVLDDGERPWVAEMCETMGARYVCRPVHDHAKAGNLNFALDLMAAEEAEQGEGIDIIAVLDCDHVPLESFLTATLGWFEDERLALVQCPQTFYNAGAFDDDGYTGEQGLFFNVLMPARQHSGAGPFWCGSTALVRVEALRDIGGVATETITEDMHTTLKLLKAGWTTAYHHQTVAVGLAPSTAAQYLLQRRRWGLGAMQILVRERLWAPKRWMTWRNFYEYLNGTLWWLEGIATLVAFIVPMVVLLSGSETSTASPIAFAGAFIAMFVTRLWGAKRLLRGEIRWSTAFALRILRVPVGMACLWWLATRDILEFEVTPKGAADDRHRGRAPRVLYVLAAAVSSVLLYATAGLFGAVPWTTGSGSTVASGVWLGVGGFVLLYGARRIRADEYATSRRNAYRVPLDTEVDVDGVGGQLVDVSVAGAAVRFRHGSLPEMGLVELQLPGALMVKAELVRIQREDAEFDLASIRALPGDWEAYRTLSLWMFHTPAGAVPTLPPGVPVIACTGSA